MVKLPHGVTVHVGGREYHDECPAHLCPKEFRTVTAGKGKESNATATTADESA